MAGPEPRGFIFDLMDQLENNANIHRLLVGEIETKIGRNVIVYHANLGHPASLMMDHDAEILENLLSTIDRRPYKNRLDFIAAGDEGTHGSPIFWDKAQGFGLNVVHEDKDGEPWKKIRELFVRVDNYASTKGLAKYFVCRNGGMDVNVQVRQLSG